MVAELRSVGLSYPRWQDAAEAVFASGQLQVVGELEGGQLVRYDDASGARLVILAAPPYGTFVSYAGGRATTGHLSMVTDIIGLIDVVADNPALHAAGAAAPVVASITASCSEGPLLSESGMLEYQPVELSALGLSLHLDLADLPDLADAGSAAPTTGDAHAAAEGRAAAEAPSATVRSTGAEQLNSGGAVPHAGASIDVPFERAERRDNALTGQVFWVLQVSDPFPFSVLLADEEARAAGLTAETADRGGRVRGEVHFTASIPVPATCGGSAGGCGSGGCGCG